MHRNGDRKQGMRGWGWRKQARTGIRKRWACIRVKWGLSPILHHDPIPEHTGLAVNESPRAKSRANPKCPLLDSLKPDLLYSSLLEPW